MNLLVDGDVLLVGVAAANAGSGDVLVAGVAGLVAGAMSMAAGEYVSVSSHAETERADLDRERKELAVDGESERNELAAIYVSRGLDPSLAKQVAEQLTTHDALTAHARGELGISDISAARPVQAALASAGTFAVGAVIPHGSVRDQSGQGSSASRHFPYFSGPGGGAFRLAHFRRQR